ncbi:MAG: hypothetical protein A2Z14_04535 [Chloroflexi bacterium RBG_16_48_8]|nr:MAG: hypothetical protein A2Z14_04535 [Chloroflexi bacterium RBG_16_48_8]
MHSKTKLPHSDYYEAGGAWSNVNLVQRYCQALDAEDFKPYFPVSDVLTNKPVEPWQGPHQLAITWNEPITLL